MKENNNVTFEGIAREENFINEESLSINQSLVALEHFLKVEMDRGPAMDMLSSFLEKLQKEKRLTPNAQLKLLELSLEIDAGRGEYSKEIFRELFEDSHRGRRLAPNAQLKLLELSLEIGNKSEAKNLLEILENTKRSKRTFSANYLNYLKNLFHLK